MNTKTIGSLGEKHAARMLKKAGYKILAKNLHQSHDEIDIIATNKTNLVFVEVKTRSVDNVEQSVGLAASAVNYEKQYHLIRAAKQYVLRNSKHSFNKQCRFDVIEIYFDKKSGKVCKTNHIINAFGIKQ